MKNMKSVKATVLIADYHSVPTKYDEGRLNNHRRRSHASPVLTAISLVNGKP